MTLLRRTFGMAIGLMLISSVAISAAGPQTPDEWFAAGQQAVQEAKGLKANLTHATNVILFIGDGMGIATVTASRILEGQLRGESGEENLLSFEKFPYVALSKTYSADQQTADSAPTMTAMVTGVKTNDGFLSVNQNGVRRDPTTVTNNKLTTILELAEDKGLSTGVVTTTRVTHATPAACYAHTVERDWEGDADLSPAAQAAGFADIARQLIEFSHGDGLEVALGGGRSKFLPNTMDDPEDQGTKGSRLDGRDLTAEWLKKPQAAYAWNKSQLEAINPANTSHLLGLFERSHMKYEVDRATDTGGEPSLSEMTSKAIDILAKNPQGFFLMVEGGRIDHAHHASNAYRALTETIEFSRAVKVALEKTDAQKTLIIVTADHSHVLTIAGYAKRGNPILGKVIYPDQTELAKDLLGLPYTTLSYANGPGYTGASDKQPQGPKRFPHEPSSSTGITAGRPDLTTVDTTAPNYLQEAPVPLSAETHGGEDVAIYATGPGAYLVHGVQEQNVIFHIIKDSLF
jgi:alkaline phosphatase